MSTIQAETITEVIKQRYSVRTYQEKPIAAETQLELTARLKTIQAGPLGSPVRLELAAAAPQDAQALRGLGTYGFIKDPAGFLMGTVQNGPHALEDYGYAMEQAILEATALGLGTCWLGGTFMKSGFAKKIRPAKNEIIPAVTSLGYALADKPARDQKKRIELRADQRLPWEALFFEGGFGMPLRLEAAGPYQTALQMVRLGPSASNKQPWRVLRVGRRWHFYGQRTPGYGQGTLLFTLMHMVDLQRLDVGIAMCHFEQTAREAGLNGAWTDNDPGIAGMDQNTFYVATWEEA